jgi:predicted transcriptional regulator
MMAAAGQDIAAAEMDVLGSLWRLSSGTVREVQQDLREQGRNLAYTTVLTLMGRLERKGHVARSSTRGLAHVYRPRVSREKVMVSRVSTMVRQLGSGDAVPLIMQLVQAHKLSAGDIRQLRTLLSQLEAEATRRD